MKQPAVDLGQYLLEPLDSESFEVSARALELAAWFLVDTISVGIAGSVLARDFVDAFGRSMCRLAPPGVSAAFPPKARVGPAAAAAVNAASVHTIDFDDSYLSGVKAHFSASILPVSIAVSEELGSTGNECLEAYVRGFEVAARLGHAVVPSHLSRWHPTGTLGVIGSAAAAAWLYGLRNEQAESAVALAADRAAGTRFCLTSGDTTKSLHAAFAAHDGIVVANLARDGVEGPRGFFEQADGFVATYTELDVSAVTPVKLDHPAVEDNCTKFLPCMHGLQAAATAAMTIGRRRPIAGADSVKDVTVYQTTGRAHMGRVWDPRTELAARLSLPYVVAVSLRERACGLEQFRPDLLGDPDLRELMSRVQVMASDELEREYGSRVASEVIVRFADGSEEREAYADPPGTPQRPASHEHRKEKYRQLAGMRLTPDAVEDVLRLGLDLGNAPTTSPLTEAILSGWT